MLGKEHLDELAREAIDAGKLVATGWAGYSHAFQLGLEPPRAYSLLRKSFYAGAIHLFTGIMAALDSDHDRPTEADMERMRSIETELLRFLNEIVEKQEVRH